MSDSLQEQPGLIMKEYTGVIMKIKCAFGIHKWEGCRCKVCRETRDQDHQWNVTGCRCLRCYRENHEWILSGTDIENEYQDGYFLNGSGQCEPEYEIIKHYNIYRCKKCGDEKREEGKRTYREI